jgi:hypothetical protein
MEFIYVTFRESRPVIVDGASNGNTNDTITVQRGRHTITLGGDQDYTPLQQVVDVDNTNFPSPLQIEFN